MIYQYYTSTLRDKCSSGAIGRVHSHVRTHWDFRDWRPRVTYPEVDLNVDGALDQRAIEDLRIQNLFKRLQRNGYEWINLPGTIHGTGFLNVEHGGWVFRRRKERKDENNVTPVDLMDLKEQGRNVSTSELSDGDLSMIDDGLSVSDASTEFEVTEDQSLLDATDYDSVEAVKVYQLPFAEKLEWCSYLWNNPRSPRITTRTSWANLLECLDVDPRSLVKGRQQADVIPTLMDGPMQSTTLSNLGLWCFILGMKELQM